MTKALPQLGMNARIFPQNWRPVREEIAFSRRTGFKALQFARRGEALNEAILGDSFATLKALLDANEIAAVMEIMVFVNRDGETPEGTAAIDSLHANLPAIRGLGIRRVHWHIVPKEHVAGEAVRQLEQTLYAQLEKAVRVADSEGFSFGLEHNEPRLNLFGCASNMQAALDAVPGLGFVWDVNHTVPVERTHFQALLSRASLVHVSDTPLPQVNHHLPIGQGNVDFKDVFAALSDYGFSGPAILEIGGTPHSGGYGKDSDEALQVSLARLEVITNTF